MVIVIAVVVGEVVSDSDSYHVLYGLSYCSDFLSLYNNSGSKVRCSDLSSIDWQNLVRIFNFRYIVVGIYRSVSDDWFSSSFDCRWQFSIAIGIEFFFRTLVDFFFINIGSFDDSSVYA